MIHMTNDENVKTLADQIDYEDAMVGIPFKDFVAIEQAIFDARNQAKVAVLAANPTKKQKAIEETFEILNGLVVEPPGGGR